MVREIQAVLTLATTGGGWQVPIITTEAVRGEGVETLVEKLAAHRALRRGGGPAGRARRPT